VQNIKAFHLPSFFKVFAFHETQCARIRSSELDIACPPKAGKPTAGRDIYQVIGLLEND